MMGANQSAKYIFTGMAIAFWGTFSSSAIAETIVPANNPAIRTPQNLAELEFIPRTLQEGNFPTHGVSTNVPYLTQTEAPTTSSAPITPPTTITPRVGANYSTQGSGFDAYTGVSGFLPLAQTPGQDLLFLEGRLQWAATNAALGGNVVLGYRFLNEAGDRLLGTYLAYDNRNTGSTSFNQIGAGIESLGDDWDFRANAYIPVGKSNTLLSQSTTGTFAFSKNNLLLDLAQQYQTALTGFDTEIGTKLFPLGDDGAVRLYGGTYYYSGDGIPGFLGVRGKIIARLSENLATGLSLQNDSQFGTRLVFNISVNLSPDTPTSNPQNSILPRIAESADRQYSIAVQSRNVNTTVTATNPQTGNPWVFRHVKLGSSGGDGTFENPSGTVAAGVALAQANEIVYVQAGTNPGTPGFTVPNQVQVLSTGLVQKINTSQLGTIQLPLSGTGVMPTVTGTVTLASNGSNQTLSGFTITNTPGSPGIVGTNNTNATIVNNTVTISAANTETGISGRGIMLTGANGTTTITSNTVSNAIGEGIRLDNVSGTATISSNTVTNTIQPKTQTGLEASIFVRNNTGTADITIANNTIKDNNSVSAFDENGTPTVSNEIDGIELGLCRPYSDFAACTSTANMTFRVLNNTITNIISPTPGADGIDINLNKEDNNGARATITISGNTMSNISDKGITFGAEGDAVVTSDITNNKISTVGDNGISLRPRRNSVAQFTVTGNTVTSAGNNGISLGLTQTDGLLTNQAQANATISNNQLVDSAIAGVEVNLRDTGKATATISNNTITNSLTTGSTRGIDVQTRESPTLNLLVDTNNISGSRADGVRVRIGTNAGTSQANVSIRNNVLLGNNTTGGGTSGLFARSQNNSNFCLQLQNNQAGSTAATGFQLTRSSPSTFQIENSVLITNTGTLSQSGTFTNVSVGTCGFP